MSKFYPIFDCSYKDVPYELFIEGIVEIVMRLSQKQTTGKFFSINQTLYIEVYKFTRPQCIGAELAKCLSRLKYVLLIKPKNEKTSCI